MMLRINPRDRRGIAYFALVQLGLSAGSVWGHLCLGVKGLVAVEHRISSRRWLVTEFCALSGVVRPVFPFILCAKAVRLGPINTQLRGFAVCVKRPFFSSQLPPLAWLAASRTPIRQLITLRSAPLVVQPQVQLLPMQPAAAKPKGRLLARLLVVCRAVYQACLLATDTDTRLTTAHQRGVAILPGPFGDIPRVAFLHFRALGAHPRKGCHV